MRFSVINIWLVLVSAALIGLPLTENFSSGIHPIDEKRLAQLALTLLGLSAVAFRPKLLNLHHPKHPFIVLIALSTLVLSCTLAYSPIMALLEASNLIAIALCCLVVANLENVSTAIIRIAAITAAVYVVVAISHLVTGVFLVADQSVILRLPGFTNIRFFSHWLTWTLPIIGALPLFHKHLANTPKYWLWTLACLWWFLFYMAAGRGTALAVTGSALLILVVAGRPAWAWFKTVSITAIAGNLIGVAFIAYEFNFFASSVHTDGGLLATSSSGRFGLWLTAWEIFLENPLFGVGTGHFAHIVPTGTTTPHNWPLMLLAENGAVTTLIIASAIALAFYKALKDAHRKPIEPEKLAFYSASMAGLIHSFFSGVQLAPYSQLWLVLIIGGAAQQYRLANPISTTRSTFTDQQVKVIVATVGCILISTAWLTVLSDNLPDPWSEQMGRRFPRFWSHGHF